MTLEEMPLLNRTDLERCINAFGQRKYNIEKKMAVMARQLRYNEVGIDNTLLDEYQKLNEELRKTRIFQAEFIYTRNML